MTTKASDTKTAETTATAETNEALAKSEPAGALAKRESFIPEGDKTGTEGITSDDLRLPRLAIAQGLSPQLLEGANYIPNLKIGDLFNDLTGEVYGKGPLLFVPIRRDVRRIQFAPRDEGGGVIDMNVPPNDPRTVWTTEEKDGKAERIPPAATKFVEFVVLLLRPDDTQEPILLSIKDTNKWNRAASTRLTGFIFAQATKPKNSAPIYGCIYSVKAMMEKNDSGTFGVPVIDQVRRLDDKTQSDEDWAKSGALFKHATAFAQSLAGKNIVANREPGDDTDFDPTTLEGQGKSNEM